MISPFVFPGSRYKLWLGERPTTSLREKEEAVAITSRVCRFRSNVSRLVATVIQIRSPVVTPAVAWLVRRLFKGTSSFVPGMMDAEPGCPAARRRPGSFGALGTATSRLQKLASEAIDGRVWPFNLNSFFRLSIKFYRFILKIVERRDEPLDQRQRRASRNFAASPKFDN